MMPPLSELCRHWVPWDTEVKQGQRFHVLYSDVRQFRQTLHFIGDDVVDLKDPAAPEGSDAFTWLNLQFTPPTDCLQLLSTLSQTCSDHTTEIAVLQTRRVESELGALKELLAVYFPQMVDDLGLRAPARADDRTPRPADRAP